MVDCDFVPGVRVAVWGVPQRSGSRAGGAADSVCGLCGVAAGMDERRGAGGTAEVLERATGRNAGSAGAADGQAAAGGAEFPWAGRGVRITAGAVGRGEEGREA